MKSCIFLFLFLLILNSTFSQKKDKIEILNANELVYIEETGINAQRLIGDVQFRHQKALMYCDSAYFFREENRMEAFGHVRINQGDTLNMYGDRLDYDGETKVGIVRGKEVRLVNKDFTLLTDKITFSRSKNTASYDTGGKIISKNDNSILKSINGYFFLNTRLFNFKKNVVFTNDDYTMKSDTMHYNTASGVARFFGPTTIIGDSNLIYCENGFYDTKRDISEYYKNAYFINKSNKLKGDTLFYNRKKGFARANGNVVITDTVNNVIVNSRKVVFYENPDSVIVTGKPLLTQIFGQDSLFMHANIFKIVTDQSDNKFMKAYTGVRIFKTDLQGACDSLTYSFTDSIIRMYNQPILWSNENQLTADRIDITTSKGKIHSLYMNANAFIISEVDKTKYNQIKGLEMVGYFKNNELNLIKVNGNGQTIYYGQDNKKKFIGVNKAESNNLTISIKNNSVSGITFLEKPTAVMYPMGELKSSELKYEGFKWLHNKRPLKKSDVFLKN